MSKVGQERAVNLLAMTVAPSNKVGQEMGGGDVNRLAVVLGNEFGQEWEVNCLAIAAAPSREVGWGGVNRVAKAVAPSNEAGGETGVNRVAIAVATSTAIRQGGRLPSS